MSMPLLLLVEPMDNVALHEHGFILFIFLFLIARAFLGRSMPLHFIFAAACCCYCCLVVASEKQPTAMVRSIDEIAQTCQRQVDSKRKRWSEPNVFIFGAHSNKTVKMCYLCWWLLFHVEPASVAGISLSLTLHEHKVVVAIVVVSISSSDTAIYNFIWFLCVCLGVCCVPYGEHQRQTRVQHQTEDIEYAERFSVLWVNRLQRAYNRSAYISFWVLCAFVAAAAASVAVGKSAWVCWSRQMRFRGGNNFTLRAATQHKNEENQTKKLLPQLNVCSSIVQKWQWRWTK